MNTERIQHWSYFSDRPVGLRGDLLWKDEVIGEQISNIAERIVAPLYSRAQEFPEGLSDSITFAIYGKWGMGKSTALRMLREQATAIAEEWGVQERLKFCPYAAPAHESLPHDVRTTLALRILTALAGSSERAVEELLQETLAIRRVEEILPAGQLEETKVSWTSRVLEEVVDALAQLIDFDEIVSQKIKEDPVRVLVVLVDDLDRCQTDFVWQVLDSIQQLSSIPNIFFVLAVDQGQLRKTVEERFERTGGAENPDFALEKYVQHATWLPDMDEVRLTRFVEQLMKTFLADDPVGEAIVENVGFLQHGLRERTPRSVKRCLNTIRFDLARELGVVSTEEQRSLIVKERILEYA